MSGGCACSCGETGKPIPKRNWVVSQRFCNYSAFSGYRRTPSKWSAIKCWECGAVWRTKAAYVYQLRDGSCVHPPEVKS